MASKTVFLIEPDDYHRDIIHAALAHHGYDVVEVDWHDITSLPENRALPDLLVVAHAGPGQSRAMMEWIGRTPEAAGIPIICVTDDAHPREMEEAIEAGCAVVSLKPLDPTDFAAQVRQLIGPSAHAG